MRDRHHTGVGLCITLFTFGKKRHTRAAVHSARLPGGSGKKLSMRRVLAFVASSFRDDRIWLRRRRPQGFNYRVFVAVDCSKSMQAMNAAAGALEAVVLLSQAFNNLQVRPSMQKERRS